jgi:hypothetical protein
MAQQKKKFQILRGFAYEKDGVVVHIKKAGVRKVVYAKLDSEAIKMGKKLKCIQEV